MAKKRMLINVSEDETRIALTENDVLVDLHVEQVLRGRTAGNIYRGTVEKVNPAFQAAFIDYGEPKNGFLSINDLNSSFFHGPPGKARIQQILRRGQTLMVQVLKEGVGAKGAALSTNIALPGRYLVLNPNSDRSGVSRKIEESEQRTRLKEFLQGLAAEGLGVIVRTAGIDRTLTELKRDYTSLRRDWKVVQDDFNNFSNSEPGIEDHVLFLKPPQQDFQGIELPHRVSPDNPEKWRRAARKQKEFIEEVFGAATEAPVEPLARWDQATSDQSVTGFATASLPDDGISSRTIAFRNTTTHVLANQFTPQEILESLKQGHAYVAHDWLCDSTGFRFFADNNLGVFEMGDTVGTGFLAGATKITANVSVPAQLKLIRNGVTVLEATDTKLEYTVQEEGAYRLEAWLNVDGEARPWIFSNPLYVRKPWDIRMPSSATPPGVQVHRDITYTGGEPGDEGKHKLDLYIPSGKLNAPVLLFLHGGNWMTGDRSLYAALGNRLARAGIAVAIPSYRLMPRNPHPAQMEDTAAAFAWVVRHVEQYGGDPKRIYVSGHSSGGHLAALLALDEQYLKPLGLSPADIRGVISMSGVYDVRYIPGFHVEGDRKDASPLYRVHSGAPRFLIAYCQWDYLTLPKQARDFAAALKKAFVDAKLLYIPGDNHLTEIINVTKDDAPLVNAILSFVE